MKTLILNSGIGNRMGALTKDKPKCLVELGPGTTILSHQIDLLRVCGIDEFVITLGPFDAMVREYIDERYGKLDVSFVLNPDYATTNYIYSMFLAEKYLEETVLLLHGDLVMEKSVCRKLLDYQAENAVIVDPGTPLPEKDFKGRIVDNMVMEIGTTLEGNDCVFLLPFYRLSPHGRAIWFDEIRQFINAGVTTVYAENAFNNCSGRIGLKPVSIDNELCMEIDTVEDLRRARRLLRECV
jgi:choline kinase